MNFWKITKKDVRLLLRDKRALFVLIALPLTFITILGFSAGQLFSQTEKGKKYRLGVLNEHQSGLSQSLRAVKLMQAIRRAREEPGDDSRVFPEVAAGKSRVDIVYQDRVPSYTVMFVFFIRKCMARSLVSARDPGTLARLMIAPLTPSGL